MEKEQLNGIEKSENEINDMDAEKTEPHVSEEIMIKLRKLFYQMYNNDVLNQLKEEDGFIK